MVNKNHAASKDYELLAKSIYEKILSQENVENIEVKHNQKVKGKAGVRRQIDVLWRFRQAGIEHLVLVECKNYSDTVELGDIDAFRSVVDDIAGARGIMVTRVGFQSGATEVARHYGIGLKLLRPPEDQDWDGYIRQVNIFIAFKNFDIQKPPILALNIPPEFKDQVANALPKENATNEKLRDKDGNVKTPPLGKWLGQQVPILDRPAGGPYKHKIELTDTYMEFERPNGELFFVPISSIDVTYYISEFNQEVNVDAGQVVKYVLKDFVSGKVERLVVG
jgi:hypothetical protein